MKGFVLSGEGVVRAEWIDENGHMNIRWYAAVFDEGTAVIVARLGLGASVTEENRVTLMAARMLIAHKKELFIGEAWQLWSGVASISCDGATISHRLVSGDSVRATCDIRGEAVSLATRERSVLSPQVVSAAQVLIVPGLRDRFADGVAC